MGVKEAENPLMDDEEEEEKDEGLLGTESLEQRLLDGGARLDDLLAPYEVAMGQVSEKQTKKARGGKVEGMSFEERVGVSTSPALCLTHTFLCKIFRGFILL